MVQAERRQKKEDLCSGSMQACGVLFSSIRGAHTGGRAVLTPGSRVPAGAISLEGALVIPGSTDPKSEKKQYLSGAPVREPAGFAWLRFGSVRFGIVWLVGLSFLYAVFGVFCLFLCLACFALFVWLVCCFTCLVSLVCLIVCLFFHTGSLGFFSHTGFVSHIVWDNNCRPAPEWKTPR